MRIVPNSIFVVGVFIFFASAAVNETMAASHGNAEPAQTSSAAARGFIIPFANPSRGRKLFASKGCVVCHSINGIGGEDGPELAPKEMPSVMNPFEFAAKMWRGAETMIALQEEELGEKTEFSGDELVDIIAFIHTIDEQKKFSKDDIPPRIEKLMEHLEDEDDKH